MQLRAVLFSLFTVILAGCAGAPNYRSPSSDVKTPLMAPMMGRVGILSLLDNHIKHVHAGTVGGSEKSYDTQFDFNGFVVEELRKGMLTKTPYQPVLVAPTGALLRAADSWQDTWNGKTFGGTFQREFEGIMAQNRLDMLVVVSCPKISGGIGGEELSGSGLYTRSFLGSRSAAVFSTLQFFRIVGKPAQLVLPVAPASDRSVGDLPNIALPEDLEDLPARYLFPVYDPLRTIVRNKVAGFLSLPRKIGA
jgi:hypothetical protein